jgi:uncharacterized RDD family membrane protein YckC
MTATADPDPLQAAAAPATSGHAMSVSPYAGLASRTFAFAIDAGVINAVTFLTGAIAAACLVTLNVPEEVQSSLFAFGGVLAFVWSIGYFVFFWSGSGQTPGCRVLDIRIQMADDGRRLKPRRALLRLVLVPLSLIPLGAGILMILVDRRRRALHDALAGTVVVYTE